MSFIKRGSIAHTMIAQKAHVHVLGQVSQIHTSSVAAVGQFNSWRAALKQCQELAGCKRARVRAVSTLNAQLHNINNIVVGPVTKIENIKTDSPKILRPTRFLGPKDIKTDLTD